MYTEVFIWTSHALPQLLLKKKMTCEWLQLPLNRFPLADPPASHIVGPMLEPSGLAESCSSSQVYCMCQLWQSSVKIAQLMLLSSLFALCLRYVCMIELYSEKQGEQKTVRQNTKCSDFKTTLQSTMLLWNNTCNCPRNYYSFILLLITQMSHDFEKNYVISWW